MEGSKVMGQKVSFLAISGHFGAFFTLFEPLGMQSEFFQKSKNTIPLANETIPSCKISEKKQWLTVEKS